MSRAPSRRNREFCLCAAGEGYQALLAGQPDRQWGGSPSGPGNQLQYPGPCSKEPRSCADSMRRDPQLARRPPEQRSTLAGPLNNKSEYVPRLEPLGMGAATTHLHPPGWRDLRLRSLKLAYHRRARLVQGSRMEQIGLDHRQSECATLRDTDIDFRYQKGSKFFKGLLFSWTPGQKLVGLCARTRS